MVGAIEIYNKPRFDYRDEVFVLLVINAWELLLKALISKSKQSIYYKKRRSQPYRTLSCADTIKKATTTAYWPKEIQAKPVVQNINMLTEYRDKAVHFYNAPDFGKVIYLLAQTSIINFRDVMQAVFRVDLGDEINWALLPLGINPPISPIAYLKERPSASSGKPEVEQFLKRLQETTKELEADGINTDRLLTVFEVSLRSVKKIEQSDITVGIDNASGADATIVVHNVDPNVSHPYRRKEILECLKKNGSSISSYVFDACVRHFNLRGDPIYYWSDRTSSLTKWSRETITHLQRLTPQQIEEAKTAHRNFRKKG